MPPAGILQGTDSSARLIERVRSLGPELHVSPALPSAGEPASADDDRGEAAWLSREGYAVLDRAAEDAGVRDALVETITRLVDDGLPAVFVYLFDEPWELGERLRARLSRMLGRPYVLAADGWAWCLPVGTGKGWAPHRDDSRRLDRRAPERVNLWLAVTDATAERSCIHVVPLDEDPGYPSNDLPTPPLAAVRAVPVAAGTAIAWNANLLHWGGACSARARGPRISISFTAVRADAASQIALPSLTTDSLSPAGRVDLVAGWIANYEDKGLHDVPDGVMAWAKATWALRTYASTLAATPLR